LYSLKKYAENGTELPALGKKELRERVGFGLVASIKAAVQSSLGLLVSFNAA
jgi:hypothetical protein